MVHGSLQKYGSELVLQSLEKAVIIIVFFFSVIDLMCGRGHCSRYLDFVSIWATVSMDTQTPNAMLNLPESRVKVSQENKKKRFRRSRLSTV